MVYLNSNIHINEIKIHNVNVELEHIRFMCSGKMEQIWPSLLLLKNILYSISKLSYFWVVLLNSNNHNKKIKIHVTCSGF